MSYIMAGDGAVLPGPGLYGSSINLVPRRDPSGLPVMTAWSPDADRNATAPMNWTPLLWIGGGLLVAYTLSRK